MSIIAARLAAIKPSPTMAVAGLALELAAAGRDVIGLAAGAGRRDPCPETRLGPS
jgi:aspartate aminotransferase